MQRRLVTWLVAILLIAHGLLGCCWHHRHVHANPAADTVASGTNPPVVATVPSAAGRPCCHHGHRPHVAEPIGQETPASAKAPANPADPTPDAPCTEDDCVFVAGSRGTVAGDQPDTAHPEPCRFDAIPCGENWPQIAVAGGRIGRFRMGMAAPGDRRALRVRTGVWLI